MKTLAAIALGTAITLNGCMDYSLSPERQSEFTDDTGYADSGQTEDTSHYVTQNACNPANWDIPSEGTDRGTCVAVENYILPYDTEEAKFSTQLYFGNCADLAGDLLGISASLVQYSVAGIEQTEYNLPASGGWSNWSAECSDDGENKNYYQYKQGIVLPDYQHVSVTFALRFFTSEETANASVSDLEETIVPSLYKTITCPANATSATDCSVRMDHYQ